MTEQEKCRIAMTVGFRILDKIYVLNRYSKRYEDHSYDHEMWLLYMGLVESYEFQRS